MAHGVCCDLSWSTAACVVMTCAVAGAFAVCCAVCVSADALSWLSSFGSRMGGRCVKPGREVWTIGRTFSDSDLSTSIIHAGQNSIQAILHCTMLRAAIHQTNIVCCWMVDSNSNILSAHGDASMRVHASPAVGTLTGALVPLLAAIRPRGLIAALLASLWRLGKHR